MNPQVTQGELSPTTVTIASTIGATIEWYDFFLYGVVTPIVLNKLFFPSYDPAVGIALAYATFAIGFVARPVGGLIFGHYGDKIGRKRMLIVTILIMGLSTFRHWLRADLRFNWNMGTSDFDRPSHSSRRRAWRRMGRRGLDGGRTCATRTTRILWGVATSRRTGGSDF